MTRWRSWAVGALAVVASLLAVAPAQAGLNRTHFGGRIGDFVLTPGVYQLRATPLASGDAGVTARASFRVTD